jgi:hypothetical protein
MNNRQIQLAQRRAALVNKAAAQRVQLAELAEPFHAPLKLADKGVSVYRYFKRHPVLLTGVVTVAAAIRPKRWLFMLENGLLIWQLATAASRKIKQTR